MGRKVGRARERFPVGASIGQARFDDSVSIDDLDREQHGAKLPGVKDRTTEFAYGWGVQWRWRTLAIRGEYERLDADVLGDLNMVSVGLTYTLPLQR